MKKNATVHYSVPKKVLSTFLAVLMVLSVCLVALPAAMTLAATVSQEHWKIAIGVPETIYTTAANNYNTGNTGIRYYVNNVVDTAGAYSLEASATATAGKFYIYCAEIAEINSITCDNANLSGLSPTKNGNLWSDTSFTMTLKSGLSSSNTRDIEWTISCKLTDGTTATFYAYTVAYAPYLSPIFAAGRVKNTRGNNSFGSGLSWVSGIHGISSAAGYYPKSNFLPVTSDSHPTDGDTEDGPDNWFSGDQQCNLPTKGGWYHSMEFGNNTGDTTDATFERSGEGFVNVDTSRYTNLNQVPNLTCGIYVTDAEGNSNGNIYGYIGKLTNAGDRITSGRDWHTDSTTAPSEWNASCTIWGGDRTTGRNKGYALRNTRMNTAPANGWMYIRGAFYTHDAGDRCFDILDCYLNVITVNKSDWRTAVQNAQNWGFQRGWFTSGGDFDTWKGYLKTVATAVGNPLTTTCDTTNLTNKTNDLAKQYNTNNTTTSSWRAEVRDYGVVKQLSSTGAFNNSWKVILLPDASNTANTISNPTDYKTVRIGDKVVLTSRATSSAPYNAFTYLGNLKIANEKAKDATFTASGTTVANLRTAIGITNALSGYADSTYTYNHITQPQLTNGEHRRAYYYQGKDVTVTVNPNGGTWNGTTNNSTVTGSYKTSWDPALPTRTGYYFDGWEFVDSNGNADSNKGTDGIYTETFSTETINNVTKKTFTKTNFVFGRTATIMRAKWVAEKYYLDVNGWLYTTDNTGNSSGNLGNKAKANVYVKTLTNGVWSDNYSLHSSGNNVNDFYSLIDYGTPYKITVTPIDGWKMDGVKSVSPSNHSYTAVTNSSTEVTVTGTIPQSNVGYAFAVRPKVIKLTLDSKYYYGNNFASSENADTAGTGAVYYKFEQSAAQDTSNTSVTGTYFTSGSNTNNTVTGKITSISKPVKSGYTFGGYYTGKSGTGTQYIDADGNFVNDPYTAVKSDITLYAYWTKDTYTITYHLNSGSLGTGVTNPASYQVDTETFTLNNPSRSGYTFTGWTGSNGTTPQTTVQVVKGSTGNKTFSANWNKDTYTITYDYAGGTLAQGQTNPTTYQVDTATFTLKNPTKTGYTFAGWTGTGITGSSMSVTIANGSTGNRSYTATWTPNTYYVHFNGNGSTSGSTGDSNGNQAFTYDVAQNLSPNHFVRAFTVTYNYNYTGSTNGSANATAHFDGWAESATGAKKYDDQEEVNNLVASGTKELYAKWTDGKVTLPNPTRVGYTFQGWYDAATGGNLIGNGGAEYTPTANKELFAHWTPHTYKFVYNANKPTTPVAASGSVNMNGLTFTTKTYAADVNLSSDIPALPGWTFAGWNTEADGSGSPFAAGAAINNDNLYPGKDGSVQLYAQWTQNDYSVRFNSSLKTDGSMSNESFAYEQSKALTPNAFVREYNVTYNENYSGAPTHSPVTFKYTFKGWSTNNHESTYDGAINYGDQANVSKLTAVDDAVVDLYAVWNGGSKALESFVRTGYDLEGWYTTVSGSSYTGGVGAPGAQYRPTADTELFANWVEHTYDIVYDANSGTGAVPASQTDCLYFTSYTVAGDTGALTKTGYTLTGWTYTKDDGTEGRVGLNGTVSQLTMNESITLYAEWTPNPYTVVFHMNDGTAVTASTTQTYDSDWVNVPDWSRAGYTLEGWYDNQACTGTAVSVTGTYRHDHNGTWDLYAKWVGLTYNVVYNSNTTDAVTGMPSPASVTKTYGTAITLASAPSRNGYQFLGWDTNNAAANGTYAADASFNADPADMTQDGTLNLYAIWAPVRYTITYTDSLSGIVPDASGTDYYYITASADGAVAALKTPAAKTGYTFAGWYVTSNGGNWSEASYGATASVSGKYGNVTLEARWIPHVYTVHYNANGVGVTDMPDPASVEKTYGTGLALAAAPSRTGYIFKGWNTNASAAADAVHMQPGSNIGDGYYTGENCTVEVYAIWQAVTYTVTYNSNEPAATTNTVPSVPDDQTKTYDTALTLSSAEPTLTGYTFTGWNTAADGSGTSYAKGASMTADHANVQDATVTLYAQWDTITYQVSFDGNGNTNTDVTMANESFEYDEEKALTANAFKREYTVTYNYNNATGGNDPASVKVTYDFAGWNTYAIGVDAAAAADYADGATVKNLMSTAGTFPLYAKWTSNSTTLPTPTRYGYTFGGWYSDAEFTAFAGNQGAVYTPTADVELYAKWTPVTYTITYKDSLDGTYSANQNYNIEGTDALQSVSKTGYDFAGWLVTDNTTSTPNNWTGTYAATETVNGKYGNVTLEAQWTPHTYTVTYNANLPKDSKDVTTAGTTTVPGDQTKTYGTDLTLNSAVPALTGYTFVGWNTVNTANTAEYAPNGTFTDSHYPGKDGTVTLYAIWAPVTYTVAFNGNGNTAGVMANQGFTYDVYQNLSPEGFTRIHTATYDYNYDTPDTTAQAEAAFIGWTFGGNTYTNEQEVVNLTSTAGATVTMTAQWTPGSVVLPTPTRVGYTFKGWFAEEACATKLGDAGESYTLNADTTFYAKWEAVTYTVEYYAGTGASGDRPANQSVVYDTLGVNAYATEGSFKKPGYSFTGWNTVENGVGGRAINAGYPFENTDLTSLADANHVIRLYAQWTPNTYVIDYDKGEGTSGSTGSQTIRYDQLGNYVIADNGFSYPGYTFTEWHDPDGVVYGEGDAVTSALLLKGVYNTGDENYHVTLTAQWIRNQSTLKIDRVNNDAITIVTQDSGTTYNVSGDFAKTGYTFTGWTLTGQNGAVPNGSVSSLETKATVYTFGNEDFVTDTLTAKWSENPYTITYHYNVEGAPASEKSVTVYYDTEFTFAPEDYFGYRLGYTIDGWATSANGAIVYDCGQVSPATQNLATGEGDDTNVDLYAIWTAKAYEVTFWVNTGFHFADAPEAASQTKTITYGGSQTFTVVLEDGYTQSTGADPAAYVDEGTAAVPDGVKTGSTIVFTVTNHGESDVVVRTNPLTLNTYTVTLIPESGDWDEAAKGYRRPTVQSTVSHGSDVTFSIALLDGYNVASGADLITSATVGGTTVTPAVSGSYTYTVANVTGNVVITLADALKNASTVKFDANGGKYADNTTLVTDTNTYGAAYTVTAPARDGYTFAGWQKVTEGTNASTAAGSLSGNTYTYGTAQGTDYYEAQWTANTYTVVFDGNNGTPNTQTATATYGQTWPSPAAEPTRTGYDFVGWCTDAEGTTSVNLSQNYMLLTGTTVYAKWTKHVYSITLDGTPEGYTVDYPQNANYLDNYTFTITPEEGYDVNAIDVNVTGNGGFTASIDNGVMTVSVTGVNDNNVITVSGAQLIYNITTNLVNPEAFASQPATVTVTYNTSGVSVEVTVANGFQNAAPSVEMVTEQEGLTAAVALKEGTTDTYVITVSGNITADVALNVTGVENIYGVTLNKGTGFVAPATETGTVAYLGYAAFVVELADGYSQTTASDITFSGVNGTAAFEQIDATHIRVIVESTDPGDVEITLDDLTADTYTLTFINNGADTLTVNSPVPAASASIGYFDTFTFSITLAEGYTAATPTLDCDNVNVTVTAAKDGSTVTYTVKDYFTANTVLTLQRAAANTSKVTIALDGGTLAGVEDGAEYTGAYKETRSFGTPSKTGYTFAGWALSSGANGALEGNAYTFGPTDGASDTLTATWTANTYTVTFDANGGVPTTRTATATYNAAYPTVEDPTRTGYDFAGWFTAAEGGDEITLGNAEADIYTQTSATTLYAHWNVHTSTLTVDPNGGKVVVGTAEYTSAHDFDGAYLDTLTVNEPTKTGYDFAGWTRTGNNGTLSGATYTFGPNETADTLTATWNPKTYTVTYYTNNGTEDYTTRTATYNAAWPEAPTVTWAGHTFDGWYTAADDTGSPATFEGNYIAAEDTAVYAHWHINHSYVLFTFDGATMTIGENAYTGSFSANGDSGDTVTIAAPVKTGYTFTGWTRTTAANGTLEGSTYTFGNAAGTADAPETFAAQFTANTYTVTFDGNDGAPNSQTATATYGAAYPAPATAVTRTGYTFAGWFTAASGGTQIVPGTTVYDLTEATTLYAHWNIHSSTVTVKANGGNWSGSTEDLSYTEEYGTAQAIPVPTREGYTFTNWALTSEGTVNGSVSGNTYTFGAADGASDILTAQWTINTSTVNVELDGGTGATEGAYTQPYGETLTLEEPTREGYTFSGWTLSTGANGTLDGVTYTFGAAKDTTDTITAQWTINTSTVTVKANGGNWDGVTADKTYTKSYGSTQAIPVPTREGYTFDGWTLSTGANGSISGDLYTFGPAAGADDILTAQWEAKTYTVVFDANGGTPTTQTATATYDAAYPTVPAPTRTGYDFAGWFTAAENGDEITLGNAEANTYTLTSATTLYAHWNKHTSYVNVNLDGGTGATTGLYMKAYGETLTLAEPTKTGYTFTGWTLNDGANGSLTGNVYTFGAAQGTEETADTVTAQWIINTYNVTLNAGVGYTVASATASAVNHGGSYSVTITLDTGYQESDAPSATVTGGASTCTVSQTGTSITYTVENITADTVITIGDATRSNYNVSVSASGSAGIASFTPADSVSVAHGEGLLITVTLDDSYSESDAPTVAVVSGAANVSGGVKSTNAAGKTVYTYTVTNVTEDTVFHIGSANPNSYFVALNATSVGYTVNTMPAPTVLYNGSTQVKITLNEGYTESDIPAFSVRIGDVTYSGEGNGHITAVQNGNEITYTVTGITANTQINIGSADVNVYSVSLDPTNVGYSVTSAPEATVNHGGSVTFSVTLAEGYSDSTVPAISATNAASAIGYKNGNTVTYVVTGITDDTEITLGDATLNTYTVIFYPGVGVTIRDYTTHEAYEHGHQLVEVPYGSVVRFVIDDTGAATPTIYANSVEVIPAEGVYSVTVTSNVNITTEDLMYTAIFIDYDRQILASYVVPCGGAAVYSGTTPTRESTQHHDYVFNGWLCVTPEGNWGIGENMTNLLENRVYQAQYVTSHKNLSIASDETNHWWYCPECDYTEGLEAHTEGGIEIENFVIATCTTKGSHDEVTYCTVCRREMSRTTVDDGYDYTNHSTAQTYSVVLYDATCTETGMKVFYCKACDHVVRYEEIPVNASAHAWGAWTDNDDGTHTRNCVYCGQGETYAHALREIYRSAPTCVSVGCVVSYCPICATVVQETLPATGVHTPGDVYWENYTAATCVSNGSYDAVRYCMICGMEISRTTETLEKTGIHRYELSNATVNGSSVADIDEADVTCGDVIVLTYTCRYCPDSYTENITVEHEYEWTMTAPTQGAPGTKTGVCTRCGDTVTETVDFEPLGQRFVQFVSQSGITYQAVAYKQNGDGTWSYDSNDLNTVKGTVTTYTNVDLHFMVRINSSFPYSDYDVYADGVKLNQNADGSYTLPASAAKANVSVLGTTPTAINPGDTGVSDNSGNGSGSGNQGSSKLSFWERIMAFFRSIGDFFRNIFSR